MSATPYRLDTPWKSRVFDEYSALFKKRDALQDFIESDTFNVLEDMDRTLLQRQLAVMNDYLEILHQRMVRF